MGKRLGFAVLAASLACGGAHAATYPAIYSFGDSLSDVGNSSARHGGDTIPSRASTINGASAMGRTGWTISRRSLGSQHEPRALLPAGGNDFAFGGAQTGETIVSDSRRQSPAIGLTDQVQRPFKTVDPSPTPGALYTLDIGGNDILNAVTALKNGSISFSDMTTTFLNAGRREHGRRDQRLV